MNMTKAQRRAFDKLDDEWRSAKVLGEKVKLLDSLVIDGYAIRRLDLQSKPRDAENLLYRLGY